MLVELRKRFRLQQLVMVRLQLIKKPLQQQLMKVTSDTGVVAEINDSGEVILSNDTGEDITIQNFDSGTTGTGTLALAAKDFNGTTTSTASLTETNHSSRAIGTIQLNSSETFSVNGTDTSIVDATATDVTSVLKSVDTVDIGTQTGSQDALAIIDGAIANIDSQRADLGAIQNRFDHTISNLANISENVSASRSRIQDTDFATETAEMTKNQILQQAGTSILSQANQLPQTALSLLG